MDYLTAIVSALLGVLCFMVMVFITNRMPAKCFCDYDETPGQMHNPPRVGKTRQIVCAVLLAAVFPILVHRFGIGLKSVGLCLMCVVLTMTALSDLRFCIIPDEFIIAGCVFATLSAFPGILSGRSILESVSPILGAAVGGGTILAINLLGRVLYKKDALGMGDLKLMIVSGIACGVSGTAIAMVIGILAAGVWFAAGIALKRISSEDYLPLGPFLVFGTVFTLCFRPFVDSLLAWYISLI